jgi:hypothetical protein
VHLSPLGFAACQSKKCTNKASMHQQSKYAPTKQVCTNTAVHAAWIEAAQAAAERGDGSRSCKCTHNKRIYQKNLFIVCHFERIS